MFEKKWEAQCEAAERIAAQHGPAAALDYLIGEKLDEHVQAAATNVKFRHELPRFVARIREIFARDDLETVSVSLGLPGIPLDGDRLRRRRFASPVATSSRAAARRGG